MVNIDNFPSMSEQQKHSILASTLGESHKSTEVRRVGAIALENMSHMNNNDKKNSNKRNKEEDELGDTDRDKRMGMDMSQRMNSSRSDEDDDDESIKAEASEVDGLDGNTSASKKSRTNHRDPSRLANIKAAIDLLLQQESIDSNGSPRKIKNLKEVSRLFKIPYNTLRDNFLR